MSFVDKINSRFFAWRKSRYKRIGINIEGDSVTLTKDNERKTHQLADLTHAIVHYNQNYVGSDFALLLRFSDGTNFHITQDNPQWFELMTALDRSGKIAVPSSKWQIDFLAAGDAAPPLDLMTLH